MLKTTRLLPSAAFETLLEPMKARQKQQERRPKSKTMHHLELIVCTMFVQPGLQQMMVGLHLLDMKSQILNTLHKRFHMSNSSV